MAQAYIPPAHETVFTEVARRGYRLDHRARGIISLNEEYGEPRKADGTRRRMALPYTIHERDVRRLAETSINASEAADRLIAVCRTNQDPGSGHRSVTHAQMDEMVNERAKSLLAEMGLTPEVVAKLKGQNGTPAEPAAHQPPPDPAPAVPEPEPEEEPPKPSKDKADLTEREWEALRLREEEGLSLSQAGKKMGVTGSRVSQLYKRAKEKLLGK